MLITDTEYEQIKDILPCGFYKGKKRPDNRLFIIEAVLEATLEEEASEEANVENRAQTIDLVKKADTPKGKISAEGGTDQAVEVLIKKAGTEEVALVEASAETEEIITIINPHSIPIMH
jgi:hypothetical protein